MARIPHLPPVYEPVALSAPANVQAEAIALARAGAEEGTLVWGPTAGCGVARANKTWHPAGDGLTCAILLRPEDPLAVAAQTALVAVVALGNAAAQAVQPMTDLAYGWPNDLFLNQRKAAAVTLHGGEDEGGRWLVVGANLNLAEEPDPGGLGAASLFSEGHARLGREEFLEAYAHQFLAWLNRWAEDGMAPVHRAWQGRARGLEEPLRLQAGPCCWVGKLRRVREDGAAELAPAAGEPVVVSLGEAFGLDGI